jgi:alkylation response protein AidB-like acyl-CoA dehydrogenase
MDFAFSDDQRLFQSTVRDLLEKECTPAAVRAAWASVDGRVPQLWDKLAAVGVVGVTGAEAAGGLGLDELDLVLLLEEAGRVALPEPLLETTGVALSLLRDAGETGWATRIAAGEATAAVALPGGGYVVGAGGADVVVVATATEVRAVGSDEVAVEEQVGVDRGRRSFTVSVPDGAGRVLASGTGAGAMTAAAFDRAALGAAAMLVGAADQLVSLTAGYAREREQFGKPIGSFQAVKHHLANARLRLEFARPAVYRAAHSVAGGSPDRSRDVSMAKVFAADAATLAARVGLQVHGAIGYTWEHDLHLWTKPAWTLAAAYGSTAWHRARVARALGLRQAS